MLRDATYTGITPEFWGSLDAVAGPEGGHSRGLTNCGKDSPARARTSRTRFPAVSAMSRWAKA